MLFDLDQTFYFLTAELHILFRWAKRHFKPNKHTNISFSVQQHLNEICFYLMSRLFLDDGTVVDTLLCWKLSFNKYKLSAM